MASRFLENRTRALQQAVSFHFPLHNVVDRTHFGRQEWLIRWSFSQYLLPFSTSTLETYRNLGKQPHHPLPVLLRLLFFQ